MSKGTLWVAIAAILWGTDSVFRHFAVESFSPTVVVFLEFTVGLIFITGWVVVKQERLLAMTPKSWRAAAFLGIFGSTIATLLYTASFQYTNASVAVLLQKLQPIFVLLMAHAFLGEKARAMFLVWSAVAFVAAMVLSFPDFRFEFLDDPMSRSSKGIFFALAATILWAGTTIGGKFLTQDTKPVVGIFWQYIFAWFALGLILAVNGEIQSLCAVFREPKAWGSIIAMGIGTEALPMVFYFTGLALIPAMQSTIIELLYPLSAVALNAIFLGETLNSTQLVAGSVLLFAVTVIARSRSNINTSLLSK